MADLVNPKDLARKLHRMDLKGLEIDKISINFALEYKGPQLHKGICLERRKLLGRVTMVYTWDRKQQRKPFNRRPYMGGGDGTELVLTEATYSSSVSINHILQTSPLVHVNNLVKYEVNVETDVKTDENRNRIAEILGVMPYLVYFQLDYWSEFR